MTAYSPEKISSAFDEILKNSEFLTEVKNAPVFDHLSRSGRLLTSDEIVQLEKQGNSCSDWKNINVAMNFTPANINRNILIGQCFIGHIPASPNPGKAYPGGIINNVISNCAISDQVTLLNNALLQNLTVAAGAVLLNNREISASPMPDFAIGHPIHVGMETGERKIFLFPELDIPLASTLAGRGKSGKISQIYQKFLTAYKQKVSLPGAFIGESAEVVNCTGIRNSYIGNSCKVNGINHMENCLLLSDRQDPVSIGGGAYLKNCILQWGCSINSLSVAEDSLLTEHVHIERHAKLSHTIIGPNSHIGAGEITSSLMGPFTAAHHQSLLIAALWPAGKGNVGYGANVGSNHTSKAPDQEVVCGEGVFFGLGTNIKFPTNFSEAPFSIIATAVNTLPQRVKFPFSLINQPSAFPAGISPAFNEIIPGWVLSDNIFAVIRNEGKYKKRNKARRSEFATEVLRPEIISLMFSAWKTLTAVGTKQGFYTEKQIPGLGKNFMTRESLEKAIGTYRFYLEYYVLRELKKRLLQIKQQAGPVNYEQLFVASDESAEWNFALELFPELNLNGYELCDLLSKLKGMQLRILQQVKQDKERDDFRGRKIFDDYEQVSTLAANNDFVLTYADFTEKFCAEIDDLLLSFSEQSK